MNSPKSILVTLPLTDAQKQALAAQAPGCAFTYLPVPKLTREQVQAAQIILGNVPPALLKGSPSLEWLQLNSAGAKDFVAPGVLPAGAILTNATGAYGLAISEHLLGMLLTIQKKLYLYRDNQHQGLWHDEGSVTSIAGSTVLIVGLGDIGGQFARKVKALGAYTIGVKRHASAKPDYLDELYTMEQLDDLLPRADIVSLSLPDTPETFHLFDRERLSRLQQSAIVLNIGRGSVFETEALCDCLASGHLAGVGLDVTDPEPLPAGHRLWSIRNAVITPHVSGGYHLPATLLNIVRIATTNLGHFMRGEFAAMESPVDFQTGYRRFVE